MENAVCSCAEVKRILISAEEIENAVKAAGEKISREYAGKSLLIAGVLTGAFIFTADLCRAVKIPCETAFIKASSYNDGTVSSGKVDITLDIDRDLSAYHVIIAEDIIDTGYTMKALTERLRQRSPKSLAVYALIDKPERRKVDFRADYTLFTIPDTFVVGYGLDCGEKFRNLPYIAEAGI